MKFILALLISNILGLYLNCSDVKSKEDCLPVVNGIYECIWYNNNCVIKSCATLDIPCDGLIQDNKACVTIGQKCQSVTECAELLSEKICKSVNPSGKQCYWNQNQHCLPKSCSSLGQNTCTTINGDICYYSQNQCTIAQKCSQITDSTQCAISQLEGKTCQWIDTCDAFDCQRIQKDCNTYSNDIMQCFTDINGKCMSCANLLNQCDCEKYQLLGCIWQNSSCNSLKCESYTNTLDCANAFDQLTCTWYGPLNQCVTIDKANSLDYQCDIHAYASKLVIYAILALIFIF